MKKASKKTVLVLAELYKPLDPEDESCFLEPRNMTKAEFLASMGELYEGVLGFGLNAELTLRTDIALCESKPKPKSRKKKVRKTKK